MNLKNLEKIYKNLLTKKFKLIKMNNNKMKKKLIKNRK